MTAFTGLGLVAKHRRNIVDGKAFDKYFGKPTGKMEIINATASPYDTIEAMANVKIYPTLHETKAIAKLIAAPSNGSVRTDLESVLRRLFQFAYNHIQYKEDAKGLEQIRTPNVIWAVRKSGVDCDDFAIFVSSILVNLGIPHSLRMCELSNKGYFQHVYVVVPKFKGANMKPYSGEYFTVDPVLDKFDQEAPSITKIFDKVMTIPLQSLSGLDTRKVQKSTPANLAQTRRVITPATAADNNKLTLKVLEPLRASLLSMLRDIHNNQGDYAGIYNVPKILAALRYALANWGDEKTRTAALEKLALRDNEFMASNFNNNKKSIAGFYGMSEEQFESTLFGIDLGELDAVFGLGQMEGLGSVEEFEGLGKAKLFTKVAAVAKKASAGTKKVTANVYNKGIKPAAKATATGVKVSAKAVANAAKVTGKAVAKGTKAVAKVATKVTFAPLRQIYRGLVAINMRGWATAMKRAIDAKQDAKLKKTWTSLPISGNWGDLVSAINAGAKKKPLFGSKKGVKGLDGVGLGIAVETAVASATPIIALITPLIQGFLPKEEPGDQSNPPATPEIPQTPVVAPESNQDEANKDQQNEGDKKPELFSKRNLIIGSIGLLTIGGIVFATSGNNKPQPAAKTNLKGASNPQKSKKSKSKTKKVPKVTI